MSVFKRLFGRRSTPSPPQAPPQPAPKAPAATDAAAAVAKNAGPIRVVDGYGRELLISREEWRNNVLPGTIQQAWSDPDKLYHIIVGALSDGFRAQISKAAEHLYEMDRAGTRAVCVWGIVLMEEGRLREAEKVFRDSLSRTGDDGYVLTNLAKVYDSQAKHKEADQTLWHALEVDPNQDNALSWYVARQAQRGEEERQRAWRRVAALPRSWRAQLWLARGALASGQWQQALELYRESLSRAGSPTPADLLMQMSGDLGNHGQIVAALRLAEPRFDPAVHGLAVGNNLLKAHVDLAQFEEAGRILKALYEQRRPDWAQTLQFWETEIAAKRLSGPAPKTEECQATMLTITGPVWLPEGSPAAALFSPSVGGTDALCVCFLGSSAETRDAPKAIVQQLSDGPGRMSRALPLFLCEQLQLRAGLRGRVLVPFLTSPRSGFVLASAMYQGDDEADLAREGDEPADYLVLTHLITTEDRWQAKMRLIRTIDRTCLEEWERAFDPRAPQDVLGSLVSDLEAGLQSHAGLGARRSAGAYAAPEGAHQADYLLRLEQLLAVRWAGTEHTSKGFLVGAREIIQGTLNLCLNCPENIAIRLLLLEAMRTMKRCEPELVREFHDLLARLQREKPLAGPAQMIVQQMTERVLAS